MKKKTSTDEKAHLYVVTDKEVQMPMDSRVLEQTLLLPLPFQQLCKLLNIAPGKILTNFMDALTYDQIVHKNDGEPHALLVEYFVSMGYGQPKYAEEDIRRMFREFRAIADLWPFGAEDAFVDAHCHWREKYMDYWLEKWQKKPL
jgi:hypothetical protein